MTGEKRINNRLLVYAAVLAAVFILLILLSAVRVNAEDTEMVERLTVTWIESGTEIRAHYNYDTDSFTYGIWDPEETIEIDSQLPEGVSYDKESGTLTIEDVALEDIFYRGTKDLKIHVVGESSFDLLRAYDERAVFENTETGNWEEECFHGGDIIVYGDGKDKSTLNFNWIWQDTDVINGTWCEPEADDGDVIIKDLTLNGNFIEAAVSNIYIDSCNITLSRNADGEYAAIVCGARESELENPEGLLSVKDSTIELTGEYCCFIACGFELNGEYFYRGNEVNQIDSVVNLENNYSYKNRGFYDVYGGKYYLITPEMQKIRTDISSVSITLDKSSYVYNGKAQTPIPTVVYNGKTLRSGTDYVVAFENNINAGTGTIVLTGIGDFKGNVRKTFTIGKAANPMKAVGKTLNLKAGKLKKKAQTVTATKAISLTNAKGTVKYKLSSVSKAKYKKYFKVNSAGKITVKKKLKKGTYKLKISVTDAGNGNYKPVTRQVTVKIKVK